VYEIFDTPLQNADGTVSKLSIVRDVTARRIADYQLRASRQQLRSLSVHQQTTREEERKAVSREIHDELGQVLATLQLGVSSLSEDCQDNQRLTDKTAGMKQLVASAIRSVQSIAAQLRPSMLDQLGLAAAIEWLAAEFRTTTEISCTSDILVKDNDFDGNMATAVFRICQEALTNVKRHSGATRAAVTLEQRNGRIVLIVTDNGSGVTREQLRASHSFGITGMRERAFALGGRVRLCRSQQGGTVVIAHIPLATREEPA
jgi:signal transduction histidine kinase